MRRTSRGPYGALILPLAAGAVIASLLAFTTGLVYDHWLTDVLAAWTLGAAWLVLVITAHRLNELGRSAATKAVIIRSIRSPPAKRPASTVTSGGLIVSPGAVETQRFRNTKSD
ncbi:phosphatase PAP2 family protein [Arthrobacter sp. B2a2-09]|uniref:hypothetical protein n=1 Tax=Arthrobacter sp. B2a2-09 TaxID=2952822 RepID=UPI0022CDBB6D|nr:hypothetical protein [Arthrobacter sp. B2a2-09]MCZ9884722.1 hypothetical protein [Arthrobacter sp. B2a2-09]